MIKIYNSYVEPVNGRYILGLTDKDGKLTAVGVFSTAEDASAAAEIAFNLGELNEAPYDKDFDEFLKIYTELATNPEFLCRQACVSTLKPRPMLNQSMKFFAED